MGLLPLVAEGAMVRRRGKHLIGPVDLKLEGAGVTMVVGPNGSGKTSLLSVLHGTLRLSGGDVRWACPLDEARKKQGFVFQTPKLLRRSVRDNLTYPLILLGVAKSEAREKAAEWAERVGIEHAFMQPARILSGGERQKLALARALIREPEVLFLDEPCSSLDGRATREIEEILISASNAGTRIMMSTHNMGQAKRLGDEVIFVLDGKLLEFRAAGAFFEAPETAQARAFLRGDIVE